MQYPDWKDMPDGISLATLSWEDVYVKACKELERNPTREETLDMFDEMADSMRNTVQDDMPAQLEYMITEIVEECLKSKPYNAYVMTSEELTFKKYCHECKEVQETYWELNYCEKNPEGIDIFTEHGNDETCEDEYCNPESTAVENKDITIPYIKSHAVHERCVQCHQYFDSAGPREDRQPEKDSKSYPHGISDTCTECGGPGCECCDAKTKEDTSDEKDNTMCSGKTIREDENKTKPVSVEDFRELFEKKVISPRIAGTISEFHGEEGDDPQGLWVSGEEGNEMESYIPAFDYYAESSLYEGGVHKDMTKWLESMGYRAEWHDPGTMMLYREDCCDESLTEENDTK